MHVEGSFIISTTLCPVRYPGLETLWSIETIMSFKIVQAVFTCLEMVLLDPLIISPTGIYYQRHNSPLHNTALDLLLIELDIPPEGSQYQSGT